MPIPCVSGFRDIKKSFYAVRVSGGGGSINAICSRPEAADDTISGHGVETLRYYPDANFVVDSFSSFVKIEISYLCNACARFSG